MEAETEKVGLVLITFSKQLDYGTHLLYTESTTLKGAVNKLWKIKKKRR